MMLLIDAGNTRIKFDWVETGAAWRSSAAYAFTLAELDQARLWLAQLPERPSRALGVSVAGAAAVTAIESLLGCPVEWVRATRQALGVRNGYLDPGQLGADRWAAMLGLAWHERQRQRTEASGPACALLATFGTATTIDTLQRVCSAEPGAAGGEFDFPGGLILPGPAMMLTALSAGTANLPQAEGGTALYPIHTHQAIATGVAAAQAGAVLRQWLAGLQQAGAPPELYVSGGGWPMVSGEVQYLLDQACIGLGLPTKPVRSLDAPVLDGLACLACAGLNHS